MKNIILFTCLLFTQHIFAQKFEISPYAGFTFGGKVLAEDGQLEFHSSPNIGIDASYFFNEKHGMYIGYNFQPTKVDVWHSSIGDSYDEVDIQFNWFQLGYTQQYKKDKLTPFWGVSLGATYIKPLETQLYPETVFSVAAKAGIKYEIIDKLGLKLTGRFLYPAGFGKSFEYDLGALQKAEYKSNFVQGAIDLSIYYTF